MIAAHTMLVIRQYLNDATLRQASMAAALNHRLQFGLKSSQARDALFDVHQAFPGDPVGDGAGLIWIVL